MKSNLNDISTEKEKLESLIPKMVKEKKVISRDTFLELLEKNIFYPPTLVQTTTPLVFDSYILLRTSNISTLASFSIGDA